MKAARKPAATQPLELMNVPDALLTLQTASVITGMSIATLYRRAEDDPTFPKLVRLGARCTRIRAGDLTAWLRALSARGDSNTQPPA